MSQLLVNLVVGLNPVDLSFLLLLLAEIVDVTFDVVLLPARLDFV